MRYKMPSIQYVKTKDFFIEKYTIKIPQTDMHYHHAYEVYYVLDGEREYFIGDKFFRVKTGDLVWVPKDMLHRTDGKGATRFLLFFKESFLQEYLSENAVRRLAINEPFVFTAGEDVAKELKEMFFSMLEEFNKGKNPEEGFDAFLLSKKLSDLLFFISTNKNYYTDINTALDERMHLIVKYINGNYPYVLGLQEIADKFGITKNHFCHAFSKAMGVTFITYLNTIRIKAACDMIKRDEDTLLEIANKCGFCSPHYFYRVFKREKGMSPSEYRNQFRKKKK